jgi:hypothetical protein
MIAGRDDIKQRLIQAAQKDGLPVDTPESSQPASPEPPTPPTQAPSPARPMRSIRFDERQLATCYSNAFRSQRTPEEIVLDFGLAEPVPSSDAQSRVVRIQVGPRVVMSPRSAKRLLGLLGKVIERHEQAHGRLDVHLARVGPDRPE